MVRLAGAYPRIHGGDSEVILGQLLLLVVWNWQEVACCEICVTLLSQKKKKVSLILLNHPVRSYCNITLMIMLLPLHYIILYP